MNTEKQGTILDVRTPEEFMNGHVNGAVNIPLQELTERMNEVKQLKSPLLLCCASGIRSGKATQLLKQAGLNCYDGGSWLNVKEIQTQ